MMILLKILLSKWCEPIMNWTIHQNLLQDYTFQNYVRICKKRRGTNVSPSFPNKFSKFHKSLRRFVCPFPTYMITSVLFQQDIFRTYVLPSDLYPYYIRTFVRFQYFFSNVPLLIIRDLRAKISIFWHLSGFPDTYLYGLSNKSVIRTFRPLATDSIVSIRGILPLLQISSSVDFGIPVSKAAWRSVKFLLYMMSWINIFMTL